MSLPGLPPLPKSLSGVELTGVHQLHNSTPAFSAADSIRGVSPLARMPTTLDTQLAVLRREMVSLGFVYIIKLFFNAYIKKLIIWHTRSAKQTFVFLKY